MRNLICTLVACVTFLSACSAKVSETQRLTNPAGTIDAVTAIRETDATVATPTEIYLVRRGAQISGAQPVFRADKLDGLSLTWKSDSYLLIRARVARVFVRRTNYAVGFGPDIGVGFSIEKEPN
jgi:hypothetical protein